MPKTPQFTDLVPMSFSVITHMGGDGNCSEHEASLNLNPRKLHPFPKGWERSGEEVRGQGLT